MKIEIYKRGAGAGSNGNLEGEGGDAETFPRKRFWNLEQVSRTEGCSKRKTLQNSMCAEPWRWRESWGDY